MTPSRDSLQALLALLFPNNAVSVFIEHPTGFEIISNVTEECMELHLAQITAALIPRYYTPVILSLEPKGPMQ